MQRARALAFAIALLATVAGCSVVQRFGTAEKMAYHTSFRVAFRRNFTSTCEAGSAEASRLAFCRCFDTGIEGRFDDDQLRRLNQATASPATQRVVSRIIKRCGKSSLPSLH